MDSGLFIVIQSEVCCDPIPLTKY